MTADMDMSIIQPDILVQVKNKALPLKRIFGVLKDMLTDVNIEFGNQVVIEGTDPEKVAATRLHLMHLEEYLCTEGDIRIGVYLSYLYKMLRGVTYEHELELVIHRSTPKVLEVTITHPSKNTRSFTAIKSIDIPHEIIEIPNDYHDATLTVSSKDFQKAIREATLISKRVCLGYRGDTLSVVASGNIGVCNVSIGCNDNLQTPVLEWHNRSNDSFAGLYFSKFIDKIIRPDISDTIDIYFTKGRPLIFQYSDKDFLGVFEFAVAEIPESN